MESHEQDQYDAYAAHLAEVLATEVKQTDTDQLIQYSTYGYALWNRVFTWRRYPEAGPVPCKLMVIVAGHPDWVAQVESDDPCGDQNRYLHHSYADQNLGDVGCTVNISMQCTNSDQTQLFMQRGTVCVYWSSCSNCYTWLSAMARVEREPLSRLENGKPDILRKAKHIHEVLTQWGDCAHDMSPYMREGDKDPVAVADDVYRRSW